MPDAAGRDAPRLGPDLRRCLRPGLCPFRRTGRAIDVSCEVWERALGALMPGDRDLADEIVAALTLQEVL